MPVGLIGPAAPEFTGFSTVYHRFAPRNSFNNAFTLASTNNSNTLALLGLLIGMLLLAFFIGIFSLVSSSGHLRTPAFIEKMLTMMSSPARTPALKKDRRTDESQSQTADPGNRSALSSDSASADGPSNAGARPQNLPPAKSAAAALQQILQQYRNDPKHTASVTITSGGRIMQSAPGPLTVHDGLPMEALKGSTELQGSMGPAAAGPAAP